MKISLVKILYGVVLAFSLLMISDCKKSNPISTPPGDGPDTTSHNFTFTQYTFGGEGGSSYFKDVAIINDSDIWAVGAIYTDSGTYNAAHWNGILWKLITIPYVYQGQNYFHPISTVFALNSNDVFFAGNGMEHWDGQSFSNVEGINAVWGSFTMNKIWMYTDHDFYVVGDGGTITYYNGGWTKLTSGTSLNVYDIWGTKNSTTGEEEILAVASQVGVSFDRAILRIQGSTVTKISDTPISYDLASIWFEPNQHYFVVGDGVYEKSILSDSLWENSIQKITTYYATCVRGNSTNDVCIVGSFGEFLHWNGASWKSLKDQTLLSNGSFTSIAVIQNLVVAVGGNLSSGELNSKAIITMGRR